MKITRTRLGRLKWLLAKCVKSKNGDCLNWTLSKTRDGYGRTYVNGKVTTAHRVIFILTNNAKLTKKQHVLHRCDNRSCCNIDHLFLGSHSLNMADMKSKKRCGRTVNPEAYPIGEAHHKTKLSNSQVRQLKRLLNDGVRQIEIIRSGKFPISYGCLNQINSGKNWKHIKL